MFPCKLNEKTKSSPGGHLKYSLFQDLLLLDFIHSFQDSVADIEDFLQFKETLRFVSLSPEVSGSKVAPTHTNVLGPRVLASS